MAATLSAASLNTRCAVDASNIYSPSCNACLVRVANKRIRNDPYRASVIAASPKKPVAAAAADCLPPVAAKRIADVFGFKAPVAHPTPAVAAVAPMRFAAVPEEDEIEVPMNKMATAAPMAAPLPSLPSMSMERYAVVEFKHELCTYQAPFRVSEGDLVVVEADRGEHAGVVKHILTEKPHFNVPCRILRHGTARDEEAITDARPREEAVTSAIQKMSDNLALGIRIVDTEFYSDGNKLTVFFASKTQVDFRKLQRGLFREYRCRIWLINYAEVQYRNKHFRNRK